MAFINKITVQMAMAFFMGSVSCHAANSCVPPSDNTFVYWNNLSSSTLPPVRFSPCFTYDPPSGQIILFGGISGPNGTYYNDTWAYNGETNTWTELTPAVSPAPRDSARMDFDPITGKIILFTGNGAGGYLGDTWTYESATNTWTEVTPALSPPPRNGATMAFDPASGCMLLFGGYGNTQADLNDTWAYDAAANTWTQIATVGTPPARDSAAMAFDETSGQMILFGGYGNNTGGTLLNDTWACTYDPTAQTYTWTELTPANAPSGRYGSILKFNGCIGQLVLFGGGYLTSTSNDTWSYDGVANTWTQVNALYPPESREFAGFSFYPRTSQMILYAGVNLPANVPVNDIQSLTFGFSPAFTSASDATFETGINSTFNVTTSGFPNPSITAVGTLPDAITFVDHWDGTATLSGTPNPDTVGVYELTLTASNGINPPATQNLTVVVLPVLPPTDFSGQIRWNKFSSGGVLSTSWNASVSPDISVYRIYKEGELIDEIASNEPLVFTTCVTSSADARLYSVVAVNADELVSPSVPVTLN